MNPLWILAAAFGALTLKGNNPASGGAPQGPAYPMFDQNLPPEIAQGVLGCASRCADPNQMLAFAGELAKQRYPVAAIFLQTRAAMLIQARNAQPQQLPPQGAPTASAPIVAPQGPQVQGGPQAVPAPVQVPEQVKRIQRTLTPEQNAKFEEYLAFEAQKAAGQVNGSAPKPEPSQPRGSSETKERTA